MVKYEIHLVWSRAEYDICWTTKDCYRSSCMLCQSTITSLGWVNQLWKLRPEWPQIDNSSNFRPASHLASGITFPSKHTMTEECISLFSLVCNIKSYLLILYSIIMMYVCTYKYIVPKLNCTKGIILQSEIIYLLTTFFKYSIEQIMFHTKFVGPNKMYNSSKSTSFFLYDEYLL